MKVSDIIIEQSDAGDNITIGEYLKTLLRTVWEDGESFSGKRPFGNSGWEYELYKPLIKAKIIDGELDDDGCIEECDESAGWNVIAKLIEEITWS